jgi:Kef-type K+ transport system membrane component KefB/mannitol/fructose-specific phosphotransferase system IIA component (Ntr-type)
VSANRQYPNQDFMSTVAALPITDPVLIFALAMVIFVGAPLLFERLRVPGIIGLIVAGAVVGPNALNLLERGSTIVLLGTVGLLYLMFMVGLELDLHDFNRYRNRSVVFGSLSFVVPQVVGTALGLLYGYALSSSLLLGAVFASHTVLAYPIASRLGIIKNLAVTTTLGGTILTEILALLVLAIVAGSVGGSLDLRFWAILVSSLAVYFGAILWGVPIAARWFFRNVRSDSTLEFVFVMAVLFTVAWLAHFAKAEPIIGALLAGLALNRLIPHSGPLMNRINFVGNALFIPFFLLSVGMLVDVQALSSIDAWVFAVGVAAGVIIAKLVAAKLTERVFNFNDEEGWVIFGLSVPHASGTLAIVLVGFELGLFDQMEVNGIVLTILATSLAGPWAVERFGRQIALQEEQKPYEPRDAPQRILIPIANPATEESLLDLAILLRGAGSNEPLHPLTVVPEEADGSEARVAEAERMLSHAVIYAAGAEVPVVPLTRVDQNVAAGIVRGIAETRTSTVVIGWDGGRSPVGGIFGSVLDQLLLQTKAMVVVAKLGHALNVTKRLVVVLPPLIYRHPGFFEAARGVKTIAAQLGAPILGLVVEEEAARLEALFQPIRPAAAAQFERVDGWSRLLHELRSRAKSNDLLIVLSARRGTLPWHPKLERLPSQLAGLAPESFLMFYPAEGDTPRREPATPSVLPRGLKPDRIVFDLPCMPFQEALREILRTEIDDPGKLAAITEALVEGEQDFSTEVRPGVVVPHARVAGIDEPILFLGTCAEGIDFPQARDPAKLIFVLLSPAERPQEHLRSLADIARLVSREEYVQELLGGNLGPDESLDEEFGVEETKSV